MTYVFSALFEIAIFILSVMGIVYVCQGEKKELPVVSSLKIIK